MTEGEDGFDASLYILCTDKVVQEFESRFKESERNEFTCPPTIYFHSDLSLKTE